MMTQDEIDELYRRAKLVLLHAVLDRSTSAKIGKFSFKLLEGKGFWILHTNQMGGCSRIFSSDLRGRRVANGRECKDALKILRQHQLLDDLANV